MRRYKVSWKRKFRGNKYLKTISEVECSSSASVDIESRPSTSSAETVEVRPNPINPTSSSKKKLSYIPEFLNNVREEKISVHIIIDLCLIYNLLNKFVMCQHCGAKHCVVLSEKRVYRKGLASKVVLSCTACSKSKTSMTSKLNKHRLYDVNTRLAYSLCAIGKGETAARTLCAIMNLPPRNRRFTQHNKHIANALATVSDLSMREAAMEPWRL